MFRVWGFWGLGFRVLSLGLKVYCKAPRNRLNRVKYLLVRTSAVNILGVCGSTRVWVGRVSRGLGGAIGP